MTLTLTQVMEGTQFPGHSCSFWATSKTAHLGPRFGMNVKQPAHLTSSVKTLQLIYARFGPICLSLAKTLLALGFLTAVVCEITSGTMFFFYSCFENHDLNQDSKQFRGLVQSPRLDWLAKRFGSPHKGGDTEFIPAEYLILILKVDCF